MNNLKHFAIYSEDMERAKAFYAALFGWKYTSYGPEDFCQINNENNLIGALQSRDYSPIDQKVIGFECSIEVVDLDQTISKITENGGRIVLPKTEIPGVGWLTKFLDTEGNLVCAVQYSVQFD